MDYRQQNEKALDTLSKGNFMQAQQLFFENAKSNPCHETYNNLGWYLCTEGLECKNGKVRNAEKLGMHYLLKAEKLKQTSVNLNNIGSMIERECRLIYGQTGVDSVELCRDAYQYFERSVQLSDSAEAEYNRLRFLFLCDRTNIGVLSGLRKLLLLLEEPDCMEFLLHTLCLHSRFQECRELMPQYQNQLDQNPFGEMSLLSLYCLCGEFEKGAGLCDCVYGKYALNPADIAMMAECLLKTGQTGKAMYLKTAIQEDAIAEKSRGTKAFCREVDRIFDCAEYRTELIQNDRFRPPFLDMCGYFGCKMHGTAYASQ